MSAAARRVLARADELATFTEEPGRITRPLATPSLAAAMARVRSWMEGAGLETRSDGLGNLVGRRGEDRLVIGSHLDSVADAGRYDGILGVLVGLEVAEALPDAAVEVVAFADEEGLRFGSTFLGSRAYLGQSIEPAVLEVVGELGPPLYEGARAYFEVHIEQGPVLEAAGLPLGVVTAIAGQSRYNVVFEGHAGHAGTTPMEMRRDALVVAAEFVLAVQRAGGTVGVIAVPDGAVNVIPGRVEATLDLRNQDDATRLRALAELRASTDALAAHRGVTTTWSLIAETAAVPCSPALTERLERAVSETGTRVHRLPSGAGHDAMTMASVTEIAMLFVRCRGGISHHPDESVEEADVALAIDVATRFAGGPPAPAPRRSFDLIVRGGWVVTESSVSQADVGVADGTIAAVEPALAGAATEEIDATDLVVLPGGLDPHVHFNEPGRTHWEGLATGSAALAAGGFTAFFDMPLNSSPPVIDGAAFDAKLEAATRASCIDFGLWGGLVPGNLDRLEELAERGVIGFKAFMSNSGIDEFRHVDDVTLYEGMAICARLGRLVAVHAENDALTSRSRGPTARDWLESRPVAAELEAISRAIVFAEDTGCALHIVHVSCGAGVALVTAARKRGVDVTCETCPHYLFLTPALVEEAGPIAKCAPPVREDPELWPRLGAIQMVTSDHSPSSPELKEGDFGSAWGGIAGAQTTRELLLGACEPEQVARLTATGPADRFGIAGKGRIEVGADADLALVRLDDERVLTAEELRYRHPISPWIGWELQARVVRTLLRGRDPEPGAGRLLTGSRPC